MQSINLVSTVKPLPQPTNDQTVTEHFKVYVYFRGIKKRCRKSEAHSMFIDYHPYNNGTYDHDALVNKVTGFLQTNVKSIDSRYTVTITLDYVQESITSQIETWMPFSDLSKTIILDSIAGFNN